MCLSVVEVTIKLNKKNFSCVVPGELSDDIKLKIFYLVLLFKSLFALCDHEILDIVSRYIIKRMFNERENNIQNYFVLALNVTSGFYKKFFGIDNNNILIFDLCRFLYSVSIDDKNNNLKEFLFDFVSFARNSLTGLGAYNKEFAYINEINRVFDFIEKENFQSAVDYLQKISNSKIIPTEDIIKSIISNVF